MSSNLSTVKRRSDFRRNAKLMLVYTLPNTFSQSFFKIEKAATTRKVIPAQNRLFVKNQTTSARSTAGMSIISKRMSNMIIIPIMTRTTSASMSNWGIESKMPRTA